MSSPAYHLRAVQPEDYRFLWSLKCQTMRPYVEKTWGRWDDAEQEAYFRREFKPQALQIIVASSGDAGLLEVVREPAKIYLARIEIRAELQGQGLGSAVIRTLQTESRNAGIPLHLQVLKVNTLAQSLYVRLGFQVTGDTATHRLMRYAP